MVLPGPIKQSDLLPTPSLTNSLPFPLPLPLPPLLQSHKTNQNPNIVNALQNSCKGETCPKEPPVSKNTRN